MTIERPRIKTDLTEPVALSAAAAEWLHMVTS